MLDLKVINSVLDQMQEERGIPKEKILEAITLALGTAYKKEYGKKGQIIRSSVDKDTGKIEFYQVKIVVDRSKVLMEDEEQDITGETEENIKVRYNSEHHILLEDAQIIKKDAKIDDEIVFPLENKENFGRIAAQTAKQVIIQKIREAEKVSILGEYGQKEGDIISGIVQRVERNLIFVDLGKATGIIPPNDQIKGENFKSGDRIRALLLGVEDGIKGIALKLSRAHPDFLVKLFSDESPEIAQGVVQIKAVAREPGSRSKIAVMSNDEHIDPIGAMVGQKGSRVSAISSELHGEKVDIIEYSEDPTEFVSKAISPAKALEIEVFEDEKKAIITVAEDEQSLAIGKGGQNVRLAAKLTGFRIDIKSNATNSTEK